MLYQVAEGDLGLGHAGGVGFGEALPAAVLAQAAAEEGVGKESGCSWVGTGHVSCLKRGVLSPAVDQQGLRLLG